VGSGIDTGAALLRLLLQRVSIEKEEHFKEILYLTALKCWRSGKVISTGNSRQLRLEMLQKDLKENETKNKDAVAWIYLL